MMMGYTYDAIGEYLEMSENTAIAHRRQVYNKLSVPNRSELASQVFSL